VGDARQTLIRIGTVWSLVRQQRAYLPCCSGPSFSQAPTPLWAGAGEARRRWGRSERHAGPRGL